MKDRGLFCAGTISLMLLASAAGAIAGAQTTQPENAENQARSGRRVGLDVAVTDADGKPVLDLQPQNFTVLDNGQPQKIVGFHAFKESAPAAGAADNPTTSVIILIDTVNTSLTDVAYARDQLAIFLKRDAGRLALPVTILILNGDSAQAIAPASQDGNALAAALEKAESSLRPIRRSEGYYGAVEKLQLSLKTVGALATEQVNVPGKKLLLWLSPGWPLLIGNDARTTSSQEQSLFNEVVALSGALRQAQITIDCISPVRNAASAIRQQFLYEEYLKPVTKPGNANVGDLSLQVLADHSGGRVVLAGSNYLSTDIANAVAGAGDYYFLVFDAPPTEKKDEYHSLKVTLDNAKATAHTSTGYYDQP